MPVFALGFQLIAFGLYSAYSLQLKAYGLQLYSSVCNQLATGTVL